MAITPDADKTAFWNRIRGDPWIADKFGLAGKSDADAAKIIRKQKTVDDEELKSDTRLILIFDPPANEAIGPFEQSVIEVDLLVPASNQNRADEILEQVIALCGEENEDRWTVNGRLIEKVVSVGDLACAAGFYRCGARFYYSSSTVRRKKTL